MADILTLLGRHWGYNAFRPMQEEIINSILDGHDTLALMPTGGGKSLCYQLPALIMPGLTIVVSPLIALMKDQVQQLTDRHIPAACIVSGMPSMVADVVMANCRIGKVKLLYVSPERLQQRRFINQLASMQVSLIAVDEAHCISQWGYDFRPPYRHIAALRTYHPNATVVALTASATPTVADDIRQQLAFRHDSRTFCTDFARPNLDYIVLHDEHRWHHLVDIVHRIGGSGIVYARSRKRTESLSTQLGNEGISAMAYHAGLSKRERDRRQGFWMKSNNMVMVATNAFGMGIDKPDVRFVVHMDMPESLEAYYQEAGRAGRDGQPSVAILMGDSEATQRLLHLFDLQYPELKYIRNVYRALCNYYQLPLGSGQGMEFDFDIEKFCATYRLQLLPCYNALHFLSNEGLIYMPDPAENQSSLYMNLSHSDIYNLQVSQPQAGNLLSVFSRMYPNIASMPVAIDERKVARSLMLPVADVVNMLSRLNSQHLVQYRYRGNAPCLVFTSDRIDEQHLSLRDQDYAGFKAMARARMDAMLNYANNDTICRQRQLMAYFGQDDEIDCGHCDVCRSRQQVADSPSAVAAPSRTAQQGSAVGLPSTPNHSTNATSNSDVEAVRQRLSICHLAPTPLVHMLRADGIPNPEELIRTLLDRNIIAYDTNMMLMLCER